MLLSFDFVHLFQWSEINSFNDDFGGSIQSFPLNDYPLNTQSFPKQFNLTTWQHGVRSPVGSYKPQGVTSLSNWDSVINIDSGQINAVC